jgi:hypothetical protein
MSVMRLRRHGRHTRAAPSNAAVAMLLAALISACTSAAQYEAERRNRLLELYPPGTLTQADIHARLDEPPLHSLARPESGWIATEDDPAGERCLASEARTGRRVQIVEVYSLPDGMFSLCYLWFYYDDAGVLTDTEWQWQSD